MLNVITAMTGLATLITPSESLRYGYKMMENISRELAQYAELKANPECASCEEVVDGHWWEFCGIFWFEDQRANFVDCCKSKLAGETEDIYPVS